MSRATQRSFVAYKFVLVLRLVLVLGEDNGIEDEDEIENDKMSSASLTPLEASVCMARVKPRPILFFFVAACTSCTTLENRRDLYRSPAEGYEAWYPQPPPTRLPSTMPGGVTTTTTTTRTEQHGAISFPEESLPERGR